MIMVIFLWAKREKTKFYSKHLITPLSPVSAAGIISFDSNGKIVSVDNSSAHYKSGPMEMYYVLDALQNQGVDLSTIQIIIGSDKTTYSALWYYNNLEEIKEIYNKKSDRERGIF